MIKHAKVRETHVRICVILLAQNDFSVEHLPQDLKNERQSIIRTLIDVG